MMPSLPPLPKDARPGSEDASGTAKAPVRKPSAEAAFSGGNQAEVALGQIETGIKQLVGLFPSAMPMLAEMIAKLRMLTGAGAVPGAPSA